MRWTVFENGVTFLTTETVVKTMRRGVEKKYGRANLRFRWSGRIFQQEEQLPVILCSFTEFLLNFHQAVVLGDSFTA